MSELEQLSNQVNIPNQGSKVYKEECTYSYATAVDEGGLYVDLFSFLAFSKQYVTLNYEKTKHRVYLHIKHELKEVEKKTETETPKEEKPKSIYGIAVESEQKFTTEETLSVVVLPEFKTYSIEEVPQKIKSSINGVLSADAETKKQAVTEWKDELKPSAYALSLQQLNNGVKVPPSGWKCALCDLTQNLWMNLTDGTILCGRKNYDGSGGNGHAAQYFQQTGFPVCVKLGTISATGPADVYSYPEDDMVVDPLLKEHLLHFGINISDMQKTEKSIDELNFDLNATFDWSRISENHKELVPVYGSGFTGIKNLGNSCYMASVMQTIFTLPEFKSRYADSADDIFKNAPSDPANDLQTQLAKFGKGLHSGHHSQAPKSDSDKEKEKNEIGVNGINPRMFKTLIGKGHAEFSTSKQQDALEFFQHLMNVIERDEFKREGGKFDPSKLFKFRIQERIECSTSKKVKYTYRVDNILSLPIPVDKSIIDAQEKFDRESKERREKEAKLSKDAKDNGTEYVISSNDQPKPPQRPKVSFLDCLNAFAQSEEIPDFYSTAINAKTIAIKQTKLSTFPEYLVVHMRKFYVGQDWTPKKLDVFLDVPDVINIEYLRGTGIQQGEEKLPEVSNNASNQPKSDEVTANEGIVSQLSDMGFPRIRCEKAAIATKNAGVDQAMNWVLEHMDDADIDTPIKKAPTNSSSASTVTVSEDGIDMLMSMGFTRDQAIRALKATDNNIERATEWIFSHADDMDQIETTTSQPQQQQQQQQNSDALPGDDLKDGKAEYSLLGFVSHLGTSTQSGHYVCHILKDGKWALYNDTKVALSEDLPKDMGYLYIFKRK